MTAIKETRFTFALSLSVSHSLCTRPGMTQESTGDGYGFYMQAKTQPLAGAFTAAQSILGYP